MAPDIPTGAPLAPPTEGTDAVTRARQRARALLATGDVPGAEAAIDELVALGIGGGRADVDAWVHLLRAAVAGVRGDEDDAGRLATRACAEFLALGPNPTAAVGLAELARVLDELQRFDEAVEALAIAAFIADHLTDSSATLVEACAELAAVFGELEVYDAAYRHGERAYVVTLAMGDHHATIDRCVALATMAARFGDALVRTGDDPGGYYERAEQAARLGLRLVDQHQGTAAQRRSLDLALGTTLVATRRSEEALIVLTRALDDRAEPGADGAAALAGLGRCRAAMGDHVRAIEHLTEAARLGGGPGGQPGGQSGGRQGDGVALGAVTMDLALSQAAVGRSEDAVRSLRLAIDAEHAARRHRRRRVTEVVEDRLRVTTDERALVRRSRTLSTDPLTGLADRRHVEGAIDELGKRWAGHAVSLVVLDVDNLDSVRQRYRDEVADQVLRRLAGVLQAHQRGDDVAARWSEHSFLVLLPRCPEGSAEQVAERLRRAVASVAWADLAFGLTVSVATGTASAPAPFDLGALVLEAGTSLAVTRALRSFEHAPVR